MTQYSTIEKYSLYREEIERGINRRTVSKALALPSAPGGEVALFNPKRREKHIKRVGLGQDIRGAVDRFADPFRGRGVVGIARDLPKAERNVTAHGGAVHGEISRGAREIGGAQRAIEGGAKASAAPVTPTSLGGHGNPALGIGTVTAPSASHGPFAMGSNPAAPSGGNSVPHTTHAPIPPRPTGNAAGAASAAAHLPGAAKVGGAAAVGLGALAGAAALGARAAGRGSKSGVLQHIKDNPLPYAGGAAGGAAAAGGGYAYSRRKVQKRYLSEEEIEKFFGGKKIAAAGLAGTMALGAGGGAIHAAPAIKHGVSSIAENAAYKNSAVGDRFLNHARPFTAMRGKTAVREGEGGRQFTARDVKPNWTPVYTKDEWKAAGKPGSRFGGRAGHWNRDTPNPVGQQDYMVDMGTGKRSVPTSILTRNTGRGD